MSTVSTHVLDTALGKPAARVPVTLLGASGDALRSTRTDTDGRADGLLPDTAGPGAYRLRFDTGAYFAATGQTGFYPEVTISFAVTEPDAHYHVPLLLSPFAYSTYRGS